MGVPMALFLALKGAKTEPSKKAGKQASRQAGRRASRQPARQGQTATAAEKSKQENPGPPLAVVVVPAR